MSGHKGNNIVSLADMRLDLLLKLGNQKERPIAYLKEVLATQDATPVQRAVAHYFLHERCPDKADKIRHLREVKRLLNPSAARAKIMLELADLDDEVEENCKAVILMQNAPPATQAMAHSRLAAHLPDRDEKIRHLRIARNLHEEAWRKADIILRLIELDDEVEANCRAIIAMSGRKEMNLNAKPKQIEAAQERLNRLNGAG